MKATLKHRDRVCQINLDLTWESDLKGFFETLEEPFPVLINLNLYTMVNGLWDGNPLNPVKFLGGSTRLQSLSLTGIPFPGLPKYLLSFTDLVDLRLNEIPLCGFFSPDAMVTALSALTRLKVLHLTHLYGPRFPSLPDRENRHLPLVTRTVLPLPSLTVLRVKGDNEHLEDFMARIDAPLLDYLEVAFTWTSINRDIVLDTRQLLRFISRIPNFQAPDKAHIGIDTYTSKCWINFLWPKHISSTVRLEIHCFMPEQQIPHLVQFCHPPFFPLPTLKYLYIGGGQYLPQSQLSSVEHTLWPEILQPFTAIKNLYLTKEFASAIAHALQGVAGEGAMILPTLENVFIEFQPSGSVHDAIGKFAAVRQLSGHPVVIHHLDKKAGHTAGWREWINVCRLTGGLQ